MAALVFEWALAPRVTFEWLGPDGETLYRPASPMPVIATVIGPRGITGAQTVTAIEALGGHRAVTADGYHCTPTTLDKLAGITKGAASIGNLAAIQTSGYMTEPSWSWTPDAPIFVGASGVLTQSAPSGVARRVAWALSTTEINIDLFPTIQLA